MLYNLNFLEPGEPWYPDSELERMDRYSKNKQLFQGDQSEVYKETLKRVLRIQGVFEDVISYETMLNYQRLVTLKTIDLLLGEPPKIIAGSDSSTVEQQVVDQIIKNSELVNTLYIVGIDIIRYGDGLFYIYSDEGVPKVGYTQPEFWFPVVDPNNLNKITHHVIAYQVSVGKNGDNSDHYNLFVQIHTKGAIEFRQMDILSNQATNFRPILGDPVINPYVRRTGLDDFAIVQVSNLLSSDTVTGFDDYEPLDGLVSEIIVRLNQISRILDKHADPAMSGPPDALQKDPDTGEWTTIAGNYFIRDNQDSPEINYITWDGQLEASFRALDDLTERLYENSELGAVVMGNAEKMGGVDSARSLKTKALSAVKRIERLVMQLDPKVKKAILLCSQLKGEGIKDLSGVDISIAWQDGIPNDPLEEAQIMQLRSANKPTSSIKRMMMRYDKLTPAQADEDIKEIEDEQDSLTIQKSLPGLPGAPTKATSNNPEDIRKE